MTAAPANPTPPAARPTGRTSPLWHASLTQAPVGVAPGRRPPVSVVILTFNEETNIRDCILSCAWCDDIHVLDSGSTDRTCEIAREMGATVHVNKFKSFGDQRNWAIDHIPCRHQWHFHLDADERFTPSVVDEMFVRLGADGSNSPDAAFLCPSKMVRLGRWLKWSGGYPSYQVRLFRYGQCRFVDFGHGQRESCEGTVGKLVEPYTHYNFSRGVLEWFSKHNNYSTREAREAIATRLHHRPRLRELFAGDATQRRRAWKNYSYFMRGRALWRFLYMFFARGGVLDGVPGLQYCVMISIYEYWTELKIKELARPWTEPTMRLTDRMMADPPGVTTPDNLSGGRINIMIPTLNESAVIKDTVLSSLKVGPVIILDSLSTDGTQQIARDAGASVVEHKFEGYAAQKNWGLDNLPFTPNCEWVFILDADERVTPGLREELLATINNPASADGYFVNRVVLFAGRAIRHGGLYPSWNLRFFRRGKCRYENRSVHEHMVCDGRSDYLREEMIHIRSESVHEWIKKHIRYADLESDEWVKLKHGQEAGADAGRLFTKLMKYRQYLRREVWPRTPFKPLLRAVYMYFIRLGVLDAVPGMHLALFMSAYEYMIELMYRDKLARIESGELPPPAAKK